MAPKSKLFNAERDEEENHPTRSEDSDLGAESAPVTQYGRALRHTVSRLNPPFLCIKILKKVLINFH